MTGTGAGKDGALIRFAMLSGVSFVSTLTITAVCHEFFHLPEEASYLVALGLVLLQNFWAMRYFVYPASASQPWKIQFLGFLASSAGFRGLEYVLFLVMHTIAGWHYLLVTSIVMVVSFITKFFFYKTAVFRGGTT